MVKSSKPMDQCISNFSFQILLGSTLEFLDSVYSSFALDDKVIESLENFNTQTTIVGNIYGAFS